MLSPLCQLNEHSHKNCCLTTFLTQLSVKLRMKEWEFKNGSRTVGDSTSLSSLQSFPSFETSTGRIIRITVVEGRNLAAKDRNGKSDPYVRLRYGKVLSPFYDFFVLIKTPIACS